MTVTDVFDAAWAAPDDEYAFPDLEHGRRPVFVTRSAASVRTIRQRWLWQDRIPLDTPSIFAGHGGEGKTTYALHLTAQLTRGALPGEFEGRPATVLIWSGEDRAETVLVPRLRAAGADLERVLIVDGVRRDDGESVPRFPDDLDALEHAVSDAGAALVILDPLTSTTTGDLHKVADVRRTLDGLAEITRRTGCVVLGIMHFNKGQGRAGDKLSGSHAFRDAVRSLFLFATDEENGQKIVTQEKNNYAENVAASLAFALESTPVATDDGETVHVARIVELGESDVSVQDLIMRTAEDEGEREDRNEAQTWLVHYLRNCEAYEADAGAAIKAGQAAGFSRDQIVNARRRSKNPRITSGQGASFGNARVWSLAYTDATDVTDVSSPRVASVDMRATSGTDATPMPSSRALASMASMTPVIAEAVDVPLDGLDPEPAAVYADAAAEPNHDPLPEPAGPGRRPTTADSDKIAARVLGYLEAGPLTSGALRRKLSRKPERDLLDDVLTQLVETGRIARTDAGAYELAA